MVIFGWCSNIFIAVCSRKKKKGFKAPHRLLVLSVKLNRAQAVSVALNRFLREKFQVGVEMFPEEALRSERDGLHGSQYFIWINGFEVTGEKR